MDDNNNTGGNESTQSQGSQTQTSQSTSTGREFTQTDTSSGAYMQKGEDPKHLTTKETK